MIIITLLLLLLLLIQISASQALNSDGQSLLSFKKSIFSDPQRAMSDWDDSDATPCRWSGIGCSSIRGESEPRVQSLVLPRRKLVGSIAPDLGSLPYLQHLNLHDNQLIGAIPPSLFNATSLQSLLLSDNDLSASISPSIARLADTLDTLDLSGNGFSGPISVLASLPNIRSLILARNRFSGQIPDGLPVSMERLDLSSNMFEGRIPADLGDLPLLQGTLNLSDNRLQGEIPAALGRLPISLSIDLSFNNLSGPIPLNGTLSNQGPTAFLGNPGLCGLPLKSRCQQGGKEEEQQQAEPARMPLFGDQHRPPTTSGSSSSSSGLINSSSSRSGLSSKQVVAIAVGDSVGIVLIAAALGYCFYCRRKNDDGQKSSKKKKQQQQQNGRARFGCGGCDCGRDGGSDTEMESDDANSAGDLFYGQIGGETGGELLHFEAESEKLFDLDALLRASAYVLGKGSSGIVYKAVMEGGLSVVVRRLGEGDQIGGGAGAESSSSSKKIAKEFESEVKFLGSIRHPNVVPLRAYYWGMNEKLLVYDFMPNGSLAAAIEQHQQHYGLQGEEEHRLSWPRRLSIAKDIARGLAFLHEGTTRRNIHGNLKPSNVLLDAGGHACIADFGIGRLGEILACHDTMSSTSSLRSDVATATASVAPCGSMRATVDGSGPSDLGENPTAAAVASCSSSMSLYVSASSSIYRPPEASPSSRPTQKWDVYSFGAILLEMLTGSASAQLACSDLDMVMAVRRMLLSSSSSYSTSHVDGVIGGTSSNGTANGTTTTTTTMLMAGIRAEAEATDLLQVALRCVSAAPEQRPKMKHVVEALQKIGTS